MKFENSGLPDKKAYRKAFQKGFDTVIKNHKDGASDAEKIHECLCVEPARFICSQQLDAKTEEKMVVAVLGGGSLFNVIADRLSWKYRKALFFGHIALYLTTEGVVHETKSMSKEERLMAQLGIYSQLLMLAHGLKGKTDPIPPENIQRLQETYDAVTKGEFPQLDALATQARQSLIRPSATVSTPKTP